MNWLKIFCYGTFVIIFFLFVSWIYLPKPHQGYYLGVLDGINSDQIIPIYCICNNWKFYPDDIAYITTDKGECLQLFGALSGSK